MTDQFKRFRSPNDLLTSTELTRRSFLKRAAIVGATLPTVGGLLGACGGGDDDSGDEETDAQQSGDSSEEDPTEEEGSGETEDSSDAEDEESDDSGTDSDSEAGQGDSGDVLTVSWWEDFLTVDPTQVRDSLATEIMYKIFSGLVVTVSGDFSEVVGDAAEEWEISEDGTEYTFNLRQGIQWHRGYGELTAEDVRWSLLRHQSEDPEPSRFQQEASPIVDIEPVDDYTAVITMEQPYPGFLIEFAAYRPGFIINQESFEELGDSWNEQPVGSGPFVLDSISPGERVDLVRFDDYFGDAGQFAGISYRIIAEESTAEIALEQGDIDIAYLLEPEIQARVVDHQELESQQFPAPRTFYLQLNQEREPLGDVRVRQALWHAMDKDLIVEAVLQGFGEATDTMFNAHVFGRLEERAYEYDPERAKELLAEAGVPDGFETSLLIYPPYGIPDMAVAMQDMWREIGVECEIIQREWAQHVELRREGNFDIGFQPMLRLGPDQYVTPTMHSTNSPYPNASRYESEEMDSLIEQARVEVDEEERKRLYHEIQRLVHEDVPVIPVLNPVFLLTYQPYIEGAVPGLLTINATEITTA